MNIAVVGATGMVGQTILKVLEERHFPIQNLTLVASKSSVGKTLLFKGEQHQVVDIGQALLSDIDIAIFSAGASLSKQYAPLFAQKNCFVIDNSSAWRMSPDIPLIIPEINGKDINGKQKIIANPNCSTIQMLMPLAVLHQEYGIKRIVVSTYQSISGSGYQAIQQYEDEKNKSEAPTNCYPHPIYKNCLPHCDQFLDNLYTKEEMKLVNETHKILKDSSISVSATAVRVPVSAGHSESVNVEFQKPIDLNKIRQLLGDTEGVKLLDEPFNNIYPMPIAAKDKDEVFVGRIRPDLFQENTINMWIVADNLRKGAATNAVQIAERLLKLK